MERIYGAQPVLAVVSHAFLRSVYIPAGNDEGHKFPRAVRGTYNKRYPRNNSVRVLPEYDDGIDERRRNKGLI